MRIRFPRTKAGWLRLFWLTLRRCPVDHAPLLRDWPLYDDGVTRYCFRCEGVSYWPTGFWHLLRMNYEAHERSKGA